MTPGPYAINLRIRILAPFSSDPLPPRPTFVPPPIKKPGGVLLRSTPLSARDLSLSTDVTCSKALETCWRLARTMEQTKVIRVTIDITARYIQDAQIHLFPPFHYLPLAITVNPAISVG